MEEGRPVGGWATRIKDVRVNTHGSARTVAGPCSTSSNTSAPLSLTIEHLKQVGMQLPQW